MSAYDCNVDFDAVVAVGVGAAVVFECTSEEVLGDYEDAITDWQPPHMNNELEIGLYHLQGTYCYDEVGLGSNIHYASSAYENLVWTKVSGPTQQYLAGSEACRKGEPCPSDASDEFILGYSARKAATETE